MITASMLAPSDIEKEPFFIARTIDFLDVKIRARDDAARAVVISISAWRRIPDNDHRPIGRHPKYNHRNLRGVYLTRQRSESPQSYLQQVDLLPGNSEPKPGLVSA